MTRPYRYLGPGQSDPRPSGVLLVALMILPVTFAAGVGVGVGLEGDSHDHTIGVLGECVESLEEAVNELRTTEEAIRGLFPRPQESRPLQELVEPQES